MRLKYTCWGLTWFLIALIQFTWVEQLKIISAALNFQILDLVWKVNYVFIAVTFLLPISFIVDYRAKEEERIREKEKRIKSEAERLLEKVERFKRKLEEE